MKSTSRENHLHPTQSPNDLLRHLWAIAQPATYIEFRWFVGKGISSNQFYPIDKCDQEFFRTFLPSSSNGLFSINPRTRADGHANSVDHYVALFVDIDHWQKTEPMFHKLYNAGIGPSAVVASGSPSHFHLYYFLDKAELVASVQPVAKRLCAYFATDPVFSPATCPRLPGTKNPKSHKQVELLDLVEARYSLMQISAALDAVGAPQPEAQKTRKPSHRTKIQSIIKPIVSQDRIYAIWSALPPWAQHLILHGKQPDDRYRSRSEADAAVVRALVDADAGDHEIEWYFSEYPDGIGSRFAERGIDYLDQTINFVRNGTPDDDLAFIDQVYHRGPNSRVVLDLDVYFGPHEGNKFQHGINSTSSVWPYLFHSAGLPVPPAGNVQAASALVDRDVRIRIKESISNGNAELEVARFLPQIPEAQL